MRGWLYSSDSGLSERDLHELADALAVMLHNMLGERVFRLQRTDVADLLAEYIDDLDPEDRVALPWIVWHLFQDAYELLVQQAR